MTSKLKKPISVVIPTCNRPTSLLIVLCRLTNQLQFSDEIIIVIDPIDSCHTKAIARLATSKLSPIRILIGQKKNNPSHLRNMGLKFAKNDQVAFLDDDCIPQQNYLSCIRKTFLIHQEKNKIIFQGVFTNQSVSANLFVDVTNLQNKLTAFQSIDFFGTKRHKPATLSAGVFFLHKAVVTQLGYLFDEKNYPWMSEQLELTCRAQTKAIKIKLVDAVRVQHLKQNLNLRKSLTRRFMEGWYQARVENTYLAPSHIRKLVGRKTSHRTLTGIRWLISQRRAGESWAVILMTILRIACFAAGRRLSKIAIFLFAN